MNRDPLLDWLHEFGLRREPSRQWVQDKHFWHGFYPDDHPANDKYLEATDFSKYIIAKGIQFESRVIECINQLLEESGLHHAYRVAKSRADILQPSSFDETVRLIHLGVPVIEQAVLWNEEDQCYGAPDLLIRSDCLPLLFSNGQPPDHIGASCLVHGKHIYVVVDIKFTTLKISAREPILLASEHEAYKAQVALYNHMLGCIQGFQPSHGYLLGRNWEIKRTIRGEDATERGQGCLDRLGSFPLIHGSRDWLNEARQGLAWIRDVRQNGHRWDPRNLSDRDDSSRILFELLPNMGNDQDQPWHLAKRQLAEESGELTLLWNVNCQARENFLRVHYPCRWDDERVNASALGVTGPSREPRLNAILAVNRTGGPDLLPSRISWGDDGWRDTPRLEFFVDFETLSNLDDDFQGLPRMGGKPLICMIGCGHFEGGTWHFSCFTADELTEGEELRIVQDWISHMEETRTRVAPELKSPRVFHWSPAEVVTLETSYTSARTRHGDKLPNAPHFYDFLNLVIKPKKNPPMSEGSECLAIKGAMGFGLKAVGKGLYKLGHIEIHWKDGPTDGLGAMVGLWWCYRRAADLGVNVEDVCLDPDPDGRPFPNDLAGMPCPELFKLIREYNEVDCKVMQECITFLRTL